MTNPKGLQPSENQPWITGLNHITLAVSDVQRSLVFYRDQLGCTLRAVWPDGAYLEAGSLWLCLSRDDLCRTNPHPDYTHIAFTVMEQDFDAIAARLKASCTLWKTDRSEGASLYVLDPDGHKIELHVGSLTSRLASYRAQPPPGMQIL